jgi:protein-histidine N-methyltransferase
MAKATVVGKKMVEANLKLISPKHSFLSSYILQERRKETTPWDLYLQILPAEFDSFPIFFTEEEKKNLKGSPFLSQDYVFVC